MLTVAVVAWSFLTTGQYVMYTNVLPVLWMTSCCHIMEPVGQHRRRRICYRRVSTVSAADSNTGWRQPTQRVTFCQEEEPNSKGVLSASLDQLPGTVCRLIYTMLGLVTLIRSKNGSREYFSIAHIEDIRRSWTPYKSHFEPELELQEV